MIKTVYRAQNIIDANLIKGILEQADIPAFVQGGYLQGGIGELPATDLVTVAVPEPYSGRAEELIASWEAGTLD